MGPALEVGEDIRIHSTSDDTRAAIAVIEEAGKLDTSEQNQPRCVDECKKVGGYTQGDGDGTD